MDKRASIIKDVFVEHYGEDRVDLVTPKNYTVTACDNAIYSKALDYMKLPTAVFLRGLTLEDFYKIENLEIINDFSKALLDYLCTQNLYDIIVHFPEVTVTNEVDNSVDIQDLFIKVIIKGDGSYYDILGKRSTFTRSQFISRYIHSHIYPLDKYNPHAWQALCFGKGPIKETSKRLKCPSSEDHLIRWRMFCIELELWTQVESIMGTPYIKMSQICSKELNSYFMYESFGLDDNLKPLLSYAMKSGSIPFGFSDSNYFIAMNDMELAFHITSLYNKMLEENEITPIDGVYCNCIINEGRLKVICDNEIDESIKREVKILDFKGNPVYLKIIEDPNDGMTYKVLKPYIVQVIASRITMVVNQLYIENGK